jgi:subtilisin family serine protease
MDYLAKQVERINEESDGDRVSVIVQMKEILQAAAEGMRRRLPIVSSRDVLPPRADVISRLGASSTAAQRRSAVASDPRAKFAYLPAFSMALPKARTELRHEGTRVIQEFLGNDFVRTITRVGKQSTAGTQYTPLWASSSIALDLTREQLKRLPEEVGANLIADIYPNRTLRVPPVQKLDTLPPEVADNRVSAWGLEKTGAMACWGAYEARGAGVKVAVLDTGVDAKHPDLKDKIAGFCEVSADGRRVEEPAKESWRDSAEHGTHCCGTVVGGRASGRWIGMAPNAKILAAMVLKNGIGTDAQILKGMEWAINKGADVISMSLGGLRLSPDVLDTYTRTIINANRLGIPVVIAIGNEGSQTSGSPGNDYFAFTVGATDLKDRAAGFSGGRTQVIAASRYIEEENLPLVYSKPDISAPGVAVYSCIPRGKYAAWNGTSMATPHVAGALALLISKLKPDAIPTAHRAYVLQSMLTGAGVELGESGQNHRFGYGRLDILRAMGHAEVNGYLDTDREDDAD